MSYSIGYIIVGTYLADDNPRMLDLCEIYGRLFPDDDGQTDAVSPDFILDQKPWEALYGDGCNIGFVGEEAFQIDPSENRNWHDLTITVVLRCDEGLMKRAAEKYESLPKEVRAALPPFGTYLIWGCS